MKLSDGTTLKFIQPTAQIFFNKYQDVHDERNRVTKLQTIDISSFLSLSKYIFEENRVWAAVGSQANK
jgi:hypothetical protein